MASVRCRQCRRLFCRNPRTRAQKTCSRLACQRARKRAKVRRWRRLHPAYVRSYALKSQAWAKAFPDYWRHYRQAHPAYCERDNERRRRARRRAARAANETLIAAISRRKLKALQTVQGSSSAANETPIHRRMSVVVDYLLWKERAANETSIGREAGHVA